MSAGASAQVQDAGRAEFTFYSGGLGDWANPAPDDTKVGIDISGHAAQRMFEALGAKAEIHECAPKGEHMRGRGDLTCVRDGKSSYHCAIGIDAKTGKSIAGMIC